jgi:hypothetical protein
MLDIPLSDGLEAGGDYSEDLQADKIVIELRIRI